MNRIFLFAILLLLISSCHNVSKTSFNSDKWKSSGGESIVLDTRFNMTEDLIKSKVLLHKTKNETDSLLGYSSKIIGSDSYTSFYLVKEVYTSDIDPDSLIYITVKFDTNGISENVKITSKR